MEERPKFITEEHLEYLDELRESGITNMYGARPYLINEFPEHAYPVRTESHFKTTTSSGDNFGKFFLQKL